MDNPTELTMGTKNTGNVNIEHEYYIVKARDKYAALKPGSFRKRSGANFEEK